VVISQQASIVAQPKFRAVSNDENVLRFRRLAVTDRGATALDLVYQAADVFRNMEEHARETEARARSLCSSAIDKVRRAEMRAEAAEESRRIVILEAEEKLEQASRALSQAQSYLEANGEQLASAEFRAQAAEEEACEAKQALALVEEAIRRRLLCANPNTDSRLTAVA
jgi:membrane protein involved in colicin uptake